MRGPGGWGAFKIRFGRSTGEYGCGLQTGVCPSIELRADELEGEWGAPGSRHLGTAAATARRARHLRSQGGQHKRHPEFAAVTRESRRNSRKTTWFPRHRKMKPFPATASQEKSHVRNWRSKRSLAPLVRPTKFPGIPVSLEKNPEDFRHHFL